MKKKNPRYKLIGAIIGCVIIISSFFALFILGSNTHDCFKEKTLGSSIIRDRCIEQIGCDPADRNNPSCGPGIGSCTSRIALEECDKTTAGILKRNISFLFGGEDFMSKFLVESPVVLVIFPMYILIWGTIGSLIGALVGFLLRKK